MSFHLLSRKVSHVREALNEWQLLSLERSFLQLTNSSNFQYCGSMAGRGYLFIEIVYTVLKHREWLEVPVFRAIAVEFLQLDHGVRRDLAQQIVDRLAEESTRLGIAKPRTLCVDDREFLTYCYVSAAGLRNDVELEIELGLGTAIIRKLRDGVKVLDDARIDVFIPEYDAMLASIIIELSHQTKNRLWALDEQRLKFKLLSHAGDKALPWILEENLPNVLQLLLDVGRGSVKGCDDLALLEVLEKAQLLISDRDGRGRIRGWDLTSEGASVSANLFKSKYGVETLKQIDLFLAMTLTWQIALLNDTTLCSIGFVMELLSGSLPRMAPQAIEIAVQRIVALGKSVMDTDTVKALLGSAKLPWHKAAVMRALVEVAPSDELASVVADALSIDASTSMMEAAGALLNKWGQTPEHVNG